MAEPHTHGGTDAPECTTCQPFGAGIHRVDKYNITILGLTVQADRTQEGIIRAMDGDQRSRFIHIMKDGRG